MASSIPSHTLQFYPKPLPEDSTFKSLMETIPPGKFYLLAPITVPYSPLPQKFVLHTDAWANAISISVNGKFQTKLIPLHAGRIFSSPDDPLGYHMEVEVGIILEHGTNNIHLEIDTGQTADLLVVASTIASLFRGYSQSFFGNLLYPLQKEQDSLMSPWSPQVMESLLRFRELLPDLRIPKTHAIKMAVRAMMAHSGTNLGVQAFATALAYNNPFIVDDDKTVDDFLALDYNLRLWQDVVSGSDFHLWLPSKAAVGWMAFARLVKNLPRVWKDKTITEEEIIIEDLLSSDLIELGPGWIDTSKLFYFPHSTHKFTKDDIGKRIAITSASVTSNVGAACVITSIVSDTSVHCSDAAVAVGGDRAITANLIQNRVEQHTFPDIIGPDFYEIVKELPRMRLGVGVQRKTFRCIGLYNYRYPLGLKVLYPMGSHILGRRPRHLGPVEAEISANGLISPTVSKVRPIESFGGWGTNPRGSGVVDSVLLTDDGDISYIFHSGGKGRDLQPIDTQSPLPGHTWAQAFRMGVDDIPDDAIISSVQVRVVARATGAGNIFGIYSYLKRAGDSDPPLINLFRNHITSAYSYITPIRAWTPPLTKQELASAVFYVTDEGTGPGFVRVTELSVDVTYLVPLSIEVMGKRITIAVQDGWIATQVIAALGTEIISIKDLLELEVTYPAVNIINLKYLPALDTGPKPTESGKIITLKIKRVPSNFNLSIRSVAGHRLGTNDGVDLWAGYDHTPILTTFTDPDTGLAMPMTITPETGFLGHSLMSSRMAGYKEITGRSPDTRSTALFGTMSGYYPSSSNLGVGTAVNTPSLIYLSVPNDSSFYRDNDYVLFPDGSGGVVTVEIKVTNNFVPLKGTPLIADLRPPLLSSAWAIIWGLVSPRTSTTVLSEVLHPTYTQVTLEVPSSPRTGNYEVVDGVDNINFVVDNDSGKGRSKFTFPTHTFTSRDIGKILVVTRSSIDSILGAYTVSQVVSDHVITCEQPVPVIGRPLQAKLIYKCQEPRPPRVKGPQAVLLSESRVEYEAHNVNPLKMFTTTWSIPTGDQTITLPVGGPTGYYVDWGDGSALEHNGVTHTYASPGTYTVGISGNCPSWTFSTIGTSASKITGVVHWGSPRDFMGFSNLDFSGCSALASLPNEPIYPHESGLTSLANCFKGTSQLTAVPVETFSLAVGVTNFSSCFQQSRLTSVPEDLFANNSVVTDFSACFSGTGHLTTIPEGLFANNPGVTTFRYCFRECAISSIPAGLFANNPAVTDFAQCFTICDELTGSIPAGLFDHNPEVVTFADCFNWCANLNASSIPAGLFDHNPKVTDFSGCFTLLNNLTSIPAGLFDHNPLVTTFARCFTYCNHLTSVPSTLFNNNPLVTSFSGCFNHCVSLSTIPSNLFLYNTKVTDFSYCFGQCAMVSFPAGMFNTCPDVTTFEGLFDHCPSLTTIPAGLFALNTKVTSFADCFNNARSLASIPSGLFSTNTKVTTFARCFYYCQNVGTIPFGLFGNCTDVTTFEWCFANCSVLVNLNSGVFSSNTKATNFDSCFYGCPYVQLRSDMFYTPGSGTNRFLNQSVNFNYCFYFPSIWTSNRGTAPDLWNCNYGTGTPITAQCFGGGANAVLTNYASIPNPWKN